MMRLAGAGFSSRYSAKPCVTAFWTSGRISELPSFVFVWPSNCGSCSFTEMTAAKPSRVSSPERLLSFSFRMPLLRAYSLMVRVTACLKPSRCVPPSCVLMLLANAMTEFAENDVDHCMATSTVPSALSASK